MMPSVIDLRSDVFAAPTDEMWAAMRSADVGWAYLGQDQSVRHLEEFAADLVGKEAALFVPTCTMANLVALMTLAPRGSRVLLEATSHIATTEAAGVAYVVGVVPQLLDGRAGAFDAATVEAALGAPQGSSAARTSVVCLENTHNNHGGRVMPPDLTAAIAAVAHRNRAMVHLDGARLFNASVALGVPARALAANVDTVAFSLNKGLGAPFGAILSGPRAVVEEAHDHLHRLGAASFHQAGILAAAALVALTTMVDRLAEDHRRARDLAERIASVPGLSVDLASVQTNIVAVDVSDSGMSVAQFVSRLSQHSVLGFPRPPSRVRFVTHRPIGDGEIERAAAAIAETVRAG
jgi:threonine aldolase